MEECLYSNLTMKQQDGRPKFFTSACAGTQGATSWYGNFDLQVGQKPSKMDFSNFQK